MKIVFLVSGNGSIFEHVTLQCQSGQIRATVTGVISSSARAGALERAARLGIPVTVINEKALGGAEQAENAMAAALAALHPNLICLAGYLKKIPLEIVRQFAGRIINIHPALLPAFGGSGMYGSHVHQAVINYGAKISGATVHFVDDEYDHGPIIAQRAIHVLPGESAESLAIRIHAIEFDLYTRVVSWFAEQRVALSGRTVTILPPAPQS